VDRYWENSTPAKASAKPAELKAPAAFLSRKGNNKDIAETHVDPWVYDKVAPNVEWAPLGRTDDEPKVDKYW
jgi:hypothetical protein